MAPVNSDSVSPDSLSEHLAPNTNAFEPFQGYIDTGWVIANIP